MRRTTSKFGNKCAETGRRIKAGDKMYYDFKEDKCYCMNSMRVLEIEKVGGETKAELELLNKLTVFEEDFHKQKWDPSEFFMEEGPEWQEYLKNHRYIDFRCYWKPKKTWQEYEMEEIQLAWNHLRNHPYYDPMSRKEEDIKKKEEDERFYGIQNDCLNEPWYKKYEKGHPEVISHYNFYGDPVYTTYMSNKEIDRHEFKERWDIINFETDLANFKQRFTEATTEEEKKEITNDYSLNARPRPFQYYHKGPLDLATMAE